MGRNSPAAVLAAVLAAEDPDAAILVAPSDHVIPVDAAFSPRAQAGDLVALVIAGMEAVLAVTDGLRLVLTSGRIADLCPSGNAPELRLCTEAESPDNARALLNAGLDRLRAQLRA